MYTFAPKQVVLYERWHSPLLVTITSTSRRCHGNHHNNGLKCLIPVIILTGKASACIYPSEHIAVWGYLGTSRLLKKSKITVKIDFLLPSAPISFLSVRLTWPIGLRPSNVLMNKHDNNPLSQNKFAID